MLQVDAAVKAGLHGHATRAEEAFAGRADWICRETGGPACRDTLLGTFPLAWGL